MRVLITSAAILSLIAGVATTAEAQTLTSVDCAAVFDDDGTRVGRMSPAAGTHGMLFEVDDIFFQLTASETAILGSTMLWYLNSTCQPPAYLIGSSSNPSPMPHSGVIGRTVYLGTGPLASSQAESYRDQSTGQCIELSFDKDLFLATEYVDLLPEWTPPFHVEAEPCPEPSTTLLQGAAAATLGTLAAKRIPRATLSSDKDG